MKHPRFSIVIPTRERAETLHYTLLSCLDQDFEDYEIIVHDNCSSSETRATVERHQSTRIRYYRSETPLAMTDSWERALSFATGEYVSIIGDDDALLVHGLKTLDQFLTKHQAPLVRWNRASYHWPSHPYPAKRNSLKIPLGNRGYWMPSREIIKRVANFELPFQTLPMLYNSAVHRDLIEEMRRTHGRMFFSPVPDVASGYALAYLAGRYLSLDTPFTIGGTSGKSGGLAVSTQLIKDDKSEIADEFEDLNRRAGLLPHPKLPNIYLVPEIIADPYYHIKDLMFPNDHSLDPDRKTLIVNTLKEVKTLSENNAKMAVQALRESLEDAPGLRSWFEKEAAAMLPHKAVEFHAIKSPRGYVEQEKLIALDPLDFGVTDVYGAAKLCEKILNYDRGGFRCKIGDFHLSRRQQARAIGRIVFTRGEATLPDCD